MSEHFWSTTGDAPGMTSAKTEAEGESGRPAAAHGSAQRAKHNTASSARFMMISPLMSVK
jgi:hypothetical protein